MNLKKCSCRHCRAGLHRKGKRGAGHAIAKRAVRHGRRMLRDMIRKGDYDNIPTAVSVSYTD